MEEDRRDRKSMKFAKEKRSSMKNQIRFTVTAIAACFICGTGTAKAALIASENFDYTGTALAGQNGGTGWAGAWGGTGTSSLDPDTGLSFDGIPEIGGRVDTISTGNATRTLQTPLSFDSGTYYLGLLMTKSDAASFDVAFSDGASDRWRMRWNASEVISFGLSLSTTTTVGTYAFADTLFVVMKMDASTGTDTISIKVFEDGDLLVEPESWDAVTTGTTGISANIFKFSGNVAGGQIDAIRIGTDFASVIPEPVSVSLLGSGALFMFFLRRRFNR